MDFIKHKNTKEYTNQDKEFNVQKLNSKENTDRKETTALSTCHNFSM
jgi:hypothetical protein